MSIDNVYSLRPIPIKICNFLDIKYDVQLSKHEVASLVFRYICENSLYDNNSKLFIPNEAIKKLFNINTNENINFYKFYNYICEIYKKS
jgi:chromatin remodeling complex protein RSC6